MSKLAYVIRFKSPSVGGSVRHLGAVLRTIRLQLAKHNFTEEAVISRE